VNRFVFGMVDFSTLGHHRPDRHRRRVDARVRGLGKRSRSRRGYESV